ncbi:MAG: glycosyltransferase family 2 protein [Nitrospirae bacterium]|nr:glycosyltransferase family 2 protein [Nitrospirota bacterium]
MTMLDISVVIPVRDEEQTLRELVGRLSRVLGGMGKSYEIIFVTDANRDNTFGVLRQLNAEHAPVKAVKLTNALGQHVAIIAGLELCRGRTAVIMDGDLQDYPEDIPRLHAKLEEGYDVVYGVKDRKNDSFVRNVYSKLFVGLMEKLSDVRLRHTTSMFRIISRRTVDEILRFSETQPSLTFIMGLIGFPSSTVKVTSGERKEGKTKYNFFRLMNFAIGSLISFSTKPIRIIAVMGFCVSALSFMYMCVVLVQRAFFKIEVLGWSTTIFLITFLGGVQLLGMGVIGEYIANIFVQTKRRPLYFIDQKIGEFDTASPEEQRNVTD